MDSFLSLLGLAYKARKIVLGEDVLNNMTDIKLVIIASDISNNSRLRIDKKCFFYHIDIIDKYDSDTLAKAIGKNNIKLIGIKDDGFKESLLKKI